MTQTITQNNHTLPEKTESVQTLIQPNPVYKFGTALEAAQEDTKTETDPIIAPNILDAIPTSQLRFFSSSEARLCLQIIKAIKKNYQTLSVTLPVYAIDKSLAHRIGDYIRLPNTQSVVIDAQGLSAKDIIAEYSKQLALESQDNMYHEFARLMTDYFKHGLVLHSVIYNAHFLKKQDFDYLYELASLIYEKFPNQRHKPLMRFIFIGDTTITPILRKKTNSHFKQFSLPDLTITECVNALYLYTPPQYRTELFYQIVGTNAAAIRIATAGYAALLRHLLPMPIAPSLADKKNPEHYLSNVVNTHIDAVYHKELARKRMLLKQTAYFTRPNPYIRLFLAGVAIVLFSILGYFLIG